MSSKGRKGHQNVLNPDGFFRFYIATNLAFRFNHAQIMIHQKKTKLNASGQASVEYLLTLTAVFIAFTGVTVLFSDQVGRYLSLLFDVIQLPF